MRDFYNMDCLEGMKNYPDKYFDLAIVDPPYGINIGGTIGGAKPFGSQVMRVGGKNVPHPKRTRLLMIVTHQKPSILKN